MLDIRVDLNPFGSDKGIRTLSRIRIANITYDCPNLDASVYIWRIQEPESPFGPKVDAWGVVTGYDRKQQVTYLLMRVLDDFWHETGQAAFEELNPPFKKQIKDIWKDET